MRLVYVAIGVLFAGCGEPTSTLNQCARAELFQACMASLPAGPETTAYNDWDEVVQACSEVARSGSVRRIEHIKPECRP